MSNANRKGYAPGINGGTPAPLGRGEILGGTVKAFFGPRQRPDAGLGSYHAPGDWPKAGSLLRVPQVAWLSASLHDFDFAGYPDNFGTFYRAYACQVLSTAIIYWVVGDTRVPGEFEGGWSYTVFADDSDSGLAYAVASGQSNTDGSWHYSYFPNPAGEQINVSNPSPQPTYAYSVTIPCPYVAEYARLIGAFHEAKARVESVRPNRTWVEVVEPWKRDPRHQSPDNRNYFTGDSWPGIYWHMVAPRTFSPYFGTRFLHVYVGSPSTTVSGPDSSPFGTYLDQAYSEGLTYLAPAALGVGDDPARFASFAARVFGVGVTAQAFPRFTAAPPAAPTHPTFTVTETHGEGPILGGTFVTTTRTVPWVQYTDDATIAASLAAMRAGVNTNIDAENRSNAARDDGNNRWLKFSCDTLASAGYDYEYAGTSDEVTADAIVTLIADHFGFDPGTGDDLPG